MLKIQVNKGHVEIEVRGTMAETSVELADAIHSIYNQFRLVNEGAAELFWEQMVNFMEDKSPVWDVDPVESVAIVLPKGGRKDECIGAE